LDPVLRALADAAQELFGVAEAEAAARRLYTPRWVESGCWLANPTKINHFDLFNQTPNTRWKGCVEARPEPYDVTDAAPQRSRADTLFVPFFWPDDNDSGSRHNNWLDDQGTMFPGTDYQWNEWGRTLSAYKYNGTSGDVLNTAPTTRGPNMNCPTPIIPLTNNRSTIVAGVNGMSHWFGGGTVTSEGLAWGWRALSPTQPFTQGAAYGTANKIIVLMTDGLNWAAQNPNNAFRSDYTAYNSLGLWRNFYPGSGPDVDSLEEFAGYMDDRLRVVCANAKEAGVEIYTVVFREPDTITRQLLRQCATDADHAFTADSSEQLTNVFAAIAQSIAALRLTR
jgi:hypothetical protein